MPLNSGARYARPMTPATLAAALALLAPAATPDDPMAAFYGNTVTIWVPDAYYFARRYVDADGTWREPHGSDWTRGVWRYDGGQICSWQTEPVLRNPRHYCYPPEARAVGETWVTKDPDTGNEVVQTLEAGRN